MKKSTKQIQTNTNKTTGIKLLLLCLLFAVFWGCMGARMSAAEPSYGSDPANATDTGQASEPQVKILMIGNSFTKIGTKKYGVNTILQELSKSNNKNVKVKAIVNGSAYLSYYAFWNSDYRDYYEKLLAELKKEQYDYIILQDQTKAAIEKYETEMLPAVRQLCTYIYAYQEHAQVLLYETAPYSNGKGTIVDGQEVILSLQEFQERTLYGYSRLEEELGVEMVPAGMKIYYGGRLYPSIGMISSDKKHPSYAGYYLAAACLYQAIFGENPTALAKDLSHCDLSDPQLLALNELAGDKITLNQSELVLSIGEKERLWGTVSAGSRGSYLQWKSLNSGIAVVNAATGEVTGISEGTTAIFAQTASGLTAVCRVTVHNAQKPQLSFGKKYYQVMAGDELRLNPQMKNWLSGSELEWFSSKPTVATVSEKGMVKANKMGSTVIRVNSNEDSDASASYTLYVSGQPPKGLAAKVTSSTANGGQVKLTWKKVNDATKYRIYRYDSNTKIYTCIGKSETNSYTDRTVAVNQYYYYKVTAIADHVLTETDYSEKVRIMVPGTVTAKVTSATSKKGIRVAWNRNSRAEGYVIYRSTKKNSGFKKIAMISSNKKLYYYDKKAKVGKTYYYRVKTYKEQFDKTYYSAYSKTVKAKIEKPKPKPKKKTSKKK